VPSFFMPVLPEDFTLETERCRLRRPCEEDFPYIYEASHTPGFNEGMPWEPPESLEDLRIPLERGRQRWQEGSSYDFAIEKKADGAFLGRISIRKSAKENVWDIGFWMHPAHQGQGFVTEAAGAIVALGFDVLGAEAVEASHATWNDRSSRVLNAIGMRRIGFVEEGFQKRGEWVAEYILRIDRPETMTEG